MAPALLNTLKEMGHPSGDNSSNRLRQRTGARSWGEPCTARSRRPLGCRTFFCDAGVGECCSALYEPAHRGIGRLHERHGVPYQYRELTEALAELLGARGYGARRMA